MKKALRITAVILALSLAVYLLLSTSLFFFPDRSACTANDQGLTTTHWQQMGGFQLCTPDSSRIGCWGTALAQLAYYHKLVPHGKVVYTSSKGFHINEDLDGFRFDLSLFAPQIDSTTPKPVIEQLSKYNYYAALVIKKDFGTGNNMDKLPSPTLFESHFRARVKRYISWKNVLPYTQGKLEAIIYEELNNKRPVYLHFANLKDFGHSVIVDAYCYEKGQFKVHLNQGQGGPTDGWYDFYKGFLRPDDNKLRVVYTFEPL